MKRNLAILVIFIILLVIQGCGFKNLRKEKGNIIDTPETLNDKDALSPELTSDLNDSTKTKENPINLADLIPKKGRDLQAFIPKEWEDIFYAEGDLNKDGLIDIAAVIEKGKGTLTTPSKRALMILLKVKNGYELSALSQKAILNTNQGGFMDPLNNITIERGTLFIEFYGGTAWRWYNMYRFRYQNNGWYLIGARQDFYYASTKEGTYEDYNLLTGDMIKVEIDGEGKEKKEKINRGIRELLNLNEFNPSEELTF